MNRAGGGAGLFGLMQSCKTFFIALIAKETFGTGIHVFNDIVIPDQENHVGHDITKNPVIIYEAVNVFLGILQFLSIGIQRITPCNARDKQA
jgi:hypothetical protein